MVEFRPSRPEDYAVLRDEIRRTVEESPAGFLGCDDAAVEAFFSGRTLAITCEVDGRAIGAALCSASPSPFNPGAWTAVVFLSVVLPGHRGKGVGLGLVREVERICAVHGIKAMLLMPPAGRGESLTSDGYAPYKSAFIKPLEAPC